VVGFSGMGARALRALRELVALVVYDSVSQSLVSIGETAYANRSPIGVTQNRAVGIRYLTCNHGRALPVVA
jgi:hypothetical protein